MDAVAKAFAEFFTKYYNQHATERKASPGLGFLFVGYDKKGSGKIMESDFPGKRTPYDLPNNTHDLQGAIWRGQIDVISRLIKGYDPSLTGLAFVNGLTETQKQQFVVAINGVEYAIPFQYLMLQDGIDLALTLVQVTVDMQRFSFGTNAATGAIPGVGGSVDVLAVTPNELTWVKKKSLSTK